MSRVRIGSSAHVRHSAGTSTRLLMYYFYHAIMEAHRCLVFRKPVSVGALVMPALLFSQGCDYRRAAASVGILRGSLVEIFGRSCSGIGQRRSAVANRTQWQRRVSLPCEPCHPNPFAQYGELTEDLNKFQALAA